MTKCPDVTRHPDKYYDFRDFNGVRCECVERGGGSCQSLWGCWVRDAKSRKIRYEWNNNVAGRSSMFSNSFKIVCNLAAMMNVELRWWDDDGERMFRRWRKVYFVILFGVFYGIERGLEQCADGITVTGMMNWGGRRDLWKFGEFEDDLEKGGWKEESRCCSSKYQMEVVKSECMKKARLKLRLRCWLKLEKGCRQIRELKRGLWMWL